MAARDRSVAMTRPEPCGRTVKEDPGNRHEEEGPSRQRTEPDEELWYFHIKVVGFVQILDEGNRSRKGTLVQRPVGEEERCRECHEENEEDSGPSSKAGRHRQDGKRKDDEGAADSHEVAVGSDEGKDQMDQAEGAERGDEGDGNVLPCHVPPPIARMIASFPESCASWNPWCTR